MVKVNRLHKKPAKKKAPAKKGVLGRIKPLDVEDFGLKMMIFGKSGTGKTTLWGSFPGKILAIICSGNRMQTGELLSLNTKEYRDKIDSVVIQDPNEIFEIVEHLKNSDEYATAVVDHVTGLQDQILCHILDIDGLPEQSSWGIASQQDWGQCTLQCKEIIRALLNTPKNIILVGQERAFDVDSENVGIEPTIGCACTPSLSGWLHSTCDYNVRTFKRMEVKVKEIKLGKTKTKKVEEETGNVQFCLQVGPDPICMTKFRKPKDVELPNVIVNPTYAKIKKLAFGHLAEK